MRQRGRIDPALALVAGIGAGVTATVIQMYGFTALFPWFVVARDWVTLTTHIVFGVTLVAACRLFARSSPMSMQKFHDLIAPARRASPH